MKLAKIFYGWPEDEKFFVPDRALKHMREAVECGKKLEAEWQKKYDEYRKAYPDLAKQLEMSLKGELPDGWDTSIPHFNPADGAIATRDASNKVINAIAGKVPWFMGGSADLSPSTKTLIKGEDYFEKENIPTGILHGV